MSSWGSGEVDATSNCKRKTKTCDFYQTSFLHKCDWCIKDGELESHPRKQCPKERQNNRFMQTTLMLVASQLRADAAEWQSDR